MPSKIKSDFEKCVPILPFLLSDGAGVITFIRPCIALEPYRVEPGPRTTSVFSPISIIDSINPFTFPNPGDLRGIPSSRNKKLPAPAPPDKTGDLIDVKCSCPLP